MTNPIDLILRGGALEAISKTARRDPMPTVGRIMDVISALPAVTDPQIATLQAVNARLVEAVGKLITWSAQRLGGETVVATVHIDALRAILAELEAKA